MSHMQKGLLPTIPELLLDWSKGYVPDTYSPIGIRIGEEKREEINFGDVLNQVLR